MTQSACDIAARQLAAIHPEFRGWETKSKTSLKFDPRNPYTKGCYWNHGGRALWLNSFGIEAQCIGPQDCRTLCKKSGMPKI